MSRDSGARREMGEDTAGLKAKGDFSVWEGMLAQRKVRRLTLAS